MNPRLVAAWEDVVKAAQAWAIIAAPEVNKLRDDEVDLYNAVSHVPTVEGIPYDKCSTILELEAKANEHGLTIYNIHHCRAGWGVTWFDHALNVLRSSDDDYKKGLVTHNYYPTPDEMLREEMERLNKLPNKGEPK